jgi:hypothetical protein
MQVIVLLVLLLAVVGIALGLTITNIRLRRECAEADRVGLLWHGRFDTERDKRLWLEELIREIGPAIIDAQGRWGFPIPPEILALIGTPSSEAVSWWLLQHAPGIGRLSDGERTTTRFSPLPEFTGWRPPQLVAARLNGEEGS